MLTKLNNALMGAWMVAAVTMVALGGVARATGQSPQLKPRAAGTAPAAVDKRMHIDVEVTDKGGAPVGGLKAGDFKLLVDKKPVEATGFSAVEETVVESSDQGGAVRTSSEPVEVILVLDEVNIGFTQVSYVRQQVEKYLRMNGGRLAAPTRLVVFSSAGIRMQNQATLDGNGMADFVSKLDPGLRVMKSSSGAEGANEMFELSLKNFSIIAENQLHNNGRKLLLWLGPGWPLVHNERTVYNESDHAHNYSAIQMLLNLMREARITVYDVRNYADDMAVNDYYEAFLKPVKQVQDSDPADLALGVLAVESGGRVTDPSNDLAAELAKCVNDASAYYTMRFEPVGIGKPGRYHSIEVKVTRPGVKVRSVTGYYE